METIVTKKLPVLMQSKLLTLLPLLTLLALLLPLLTLLQLADL
jgi:hypothetical protein